MKKIGTVAGASIAAFAVGATVAGGIAIATADDQGAATSSTTGSRFGGPMSGPMMGEERGPGELVTGEDAQKAIDAALAAVPGTADHVHRLDDGTYRVMVRTTDGRNVVVSLDAGFAVTDQQEMGPGGPGGHHGPGIPATAEEAQKAGDAALAKLPGATVLQVFKRDDDGFAVLLRTDHGRKRVVLLDENYGFQSVESPRKHRGGPRGGHHGMFGRDVVGPAFKKAEAAALAEVPNGTVLDVHKVGRKYVAFVKKDDGTIVALKMNADFQVTGTRTMDFPPGPGPRAAATSPASSA